MHVVSLILVCLLDATLARVNRTVIPNGVVVERVADAWPLAAKWCLVVTIDAPVTPPMRAWTAAVRAEMALRAYALQPADRARNLARLATLDLMEGGLPSSAPTRRRVKRGLINVIGDLSSALFGTATQAEVNQLRQVLRETQVGQRALFHNQEKMVSVINITRDYLQRNCDDMLILQNQTDEFFSMLLHMQYNAKRLAQRVSSLWVARGLDRWIDQLTEVASGFRQQWAHYRRARLHLQEDRLSEYIVSRADLGAVLDSLQHHAHVMPLDWYYAHTPVTMLWEHEGRLVATADIWAGEEEPFQLWKLRAFPVYSVNALLRLLVEPLVAVNARRTEAFTVQTCRGRTVRVCDGRVRTSQSCELDIVSGVTPRCDLEATTPSPSLGIWPLQGGRWLLSAHNATSITVHCRNAAPETITVAGVEVWSLTGDCQLEWGHSRTSVVSSRSSQLHYSYDVFVAPNVTIELPPHLRQELPTRLRIDSKIRIPATDLVLEEVPRGNLIPPQHWHTWLVAALALLVMLAGGAWQFRAFFLGRCAPQAVSDEVLSAAID